jgi:hypothetical protein
MTLKFDGKRVSPHTNPLRINSKKKGMEAPLLRSSSSFSTPELYFCCVSPKQVKLDTMAVCPPFPKAVFKKSNVLMR